MAVTMSSQASFVTACEAPPSITSQPSSEPSQAAQPTPDTPRRPLYRPSKPLTYAVRSHIAVYLEGSMSKASELICRHTAADHEAFTFLTHLLNAGTDVSAPHRLFSASVPPPQYLAMAATLAVHPSLTTRTEDREKQNAANSALQYLRLVNKVVGPLHADLSTTFAFTESGSRTARRRRGRGVGRSESPGGTDVGGGAIKSRYADADSVFARGGDFWQVVGWAFNCSVLHPRRWERWSLWLDMVLEVLEADLAARMANVEEAAEKGGIPRAEDTIIQSLVVRYVEGAGQGRTAWRRMMRAVLADGSKKAVSEFREVWEGETREPRKTEEKKARAREVDIEGDKWGDYDLSDEEDEVVNGHESHLRVRSSRNSTRHQSDRSEGSGSEEGQNEDHAAKENSTAHLLGGLDSILLRQRVIALLSKVSELRPNALTHQGELFDVFTEFLRPLPLPTFSTFLTTSPLAPMTQASLCANLLLPLITTAPPSYNTLLLSQPDLERFFLPAPANGNSYVDNAKVSLLLQTIVMQMFASGKIVPTEAFGAAVEEGVRARREKAIGDARKRGKGREGEEKEARGVLEGSERMLMVVLEVVESG
ncbi:hypothetical protein H2201_002227 [Coniosporium apollinis]|uniref:Uncharacterized protein n=1 Tax=Coniosporium apollinis TaxID=61459 RepID=A0ABQ9NZW6_9PEZI|nr:hypothetical protein H2201_002227 [Coniosporium apollinis]